MYALLISLLIAEPPTFTVVPGFVVTAAPVKVAPVKVKRIVAKPVIHSHLCPQCGNEFWHDDSSFGKAGDHHCPNCGYGPIWNVNRRVH